MHDSCVILLKLNLDVKISLRRSQACTDLFTRTYWENLSPRRSLIGLSMHEIIHIESPKSEDIHFLAPLASF